MKFAAIAVAMLFTLCGAGIAQADDSDWAGLYQAVDPVDGSINYMSIAPQDDGHFVLHIVVSDHGMCDAPAVIVASGRLQNDAMIREDVFLRCHGSAEDVPHSEATYSLDAANGIIVYSAAFDGRTMYFHRISATD
jgi:hypothetical protein